MEACDANGQWGGAVACSAMTAFCANGACTSVPPSCQPGGSGLTDCGEGTESCCTNLAVTGGTFFRTYTNSGSGPAEEADPASVSSFFLDKYLVTVGRFRQFVTAWSGSYAPPVGSGKHAHLNGGLGLANSGTGGGYESGWVASDGNNIAPTDHNLACDSTTPGSGSLTYATWTPSAGTQENLPINCLNWWEAYAFCIWDGGFLPSEAEWEYAAAGGQEEREYPWGSTAPGLGNEYAIYECHYPMSARSCSGIASIAPVGTATLGAAFWGQLDMAGNVRVWSMDWFSPYVSPCTDCASLASASSMTRVVRSGNFYYSSSDLRPPIRHQSQAGVDRYYDVGVRCARSAP